MKSGVYRIDIGEGHFYIGSAVDVSRRKINHLSDLRRGVHSNRHMQNCWSKYQYFEFQVLEFAEPDCILDIEQKYIDMHIDDPLCVNIKAIADNRLGCSVGPETRQRMREAQLGKRHSVETRAKISEIQKGRSLTPEWREAIGKGHRGKKRSDEARRAISEGAKNRSPAGRANISAAKRGEKNPMWNKPVSEETRRKRSETMKQTIAEKRAAGGTWPLNPK